MRCNDSPVHKSQLSLRRAPTERKAVGLKPVFLLGWSRVFSSHTRGSAVRRWHGWLNSRLVFYLFAVMLNRAPRCRTDDRVMARDMAGDAANSGAFQTSLGAGKRWKHERGDSDCEGDDKLMHLNSGRGSNAESMQG